MTKSELARYLVFVTLVAWARVLDHFGYARFRDVMAGMLLFFVLGIYEMVGEIRDERASNKKEEKP